MPLNTVIFDMDGLLIDSEPLWQEAGKEMLSTFDVTLTEEQYHSSTGLRTPEWIDHWFDFFNIDRTNTIETITAIENSAIDKIRRSALVMPGVDYILKFFKDRGFQIGLASSSPMRLIDVVIDKLNIRDLLDAATSAEGLPYGKPHPQVFIDCAAALKMPPAQCIVFEDSFNGMIAAKAAKMKCVVVPPPSLAEGKQWGAADLKLGSLEDFNEKKLEMLARR
jgi:mannitol-1-/sugar-/sorbitol-6-/2-deoxyglucose-6-phosphatase